MRKTVSIQMVILLVLLLTFFSGCGGLSSEGESDSNTIHDTGETNDNDSAASKGIIGIWTEDMQFSCENFSQVAPLTPIEEIQFEDDGTFGVTWEAFETYVDYWGNYTYDETAGTLVLEVTGGNYTPPDLDLDGTITIDDENRIILADFWFGSKKGEAEDALCGHRLVRY